MKLSSMEVTHSSEDDSPTNTEDKNSLDNNQWTSEQQYYWTNEQALDLIRFYKEYISSNKVNQRRKKPMWEHIAAKMRESGSTHCTANHCATKYTCMTRQYRVVTENNVIPGNRKRSCFFYDALSEVYDYTPVVGQPSESKLDDDYTCNGHQSSSKSNKLMSLINHISDDDREQEQKSLDKLEEMQKEKMEMFSAFLKTITVSENTSRQVSQKERRKCKTVECKKEQSSSDSGDNMQDSEVDDGHDVHDTISKTLDVVLDPDENVWTELWSKETSDAFINLLEKHKSMWIDQTCKKQTFWELIVSELNKEMGMSLKSQQAENHFKVLTKKYRNVIETNSKPGAKLITCVYFKELSELFSSNPKGWYYLPKVFSPQVSDTNHHTEPKREKKSELLSLLKQIHTERKQEEQKKMERLKRMHDDKIKIFSSFLDVVKKMKK